MNALPPFHASSAPVTAAELGASWHPGCPVGPSQLRTVTVSYVGFDGRAHTGALVVNSAVVADTEAVFRRLYAARFPIKRMGPIARYGGSDTRSMAVDNTSAFNCRYAIAPGPKRWSVHAFGEAIDVNTIENPYLEGGKVLPPAGRAHLDRTRYRKGMATADGVLVRAFASVGWLWGGRWTGSPDWQHFSKTGG
ncbi:MAG TPA: M15 family metallopeptidase [Gaiellaceae bacterium]|nr:M15 family metallopeptidase [Gaiellaceae bacterium]